MSLSTDKYIDNDKVYIVWGWDDIQHLRPGWSIKQCQEALNNIAKQLQNGSIQEGWEIIENLLDYKYQDDGKKEYCEICKAEVCFEKSNYKGENTPFEYNVCNNCERHICPNCTDFRNETPLCRNCMEDDGEE